MKVLDLKLWRDLMHMKGQVLAIAGIVASGTGLLVMSLSVHEALSTTAEAYYQRYHFADVFATLRRAPDVVREQIADIDGVQVVQTRIVNVATLEIPGINEPILGQLVSLPQHGKAILNQLVLRSGRMPDPLRDDEVVVSEQFAEAHQFRLGDQFFALMNGRKQSLSIVGTALSPEYIYAMAPGAMMPDDRRYGIMWLRRHVLAAAFDLDGAFNDVSLTLSRSASPQAVIQRLDVLLARYGGIGAIARKDQISNWFVMNEIEQLENLANILPTIFLLVAMFLTNVVLMRLVSIERSEIGLLKANGYTNVQVSLHYLKLVAVIAGLGVLAGSVIGVALGRLNTEMYTQLYRFPLLLYRPQLWIFVVAAVVSLGAAWLGAVNAVGRVVRLPPAEAMRPPQPTHFRRSFLAKFSVFQRFDQATRIVLRRIARGPIRAGISTLGIAAGIAVMIMALQWIDSIAALVRVQYFEAQHQDLTVGLTDARAQGVSYDFANLAGVLVVEPTRAVSADFSAGAKRHRGGIEGLSANSTLRPLHDVSKGALNISPGGIVLSSLLAQKLGVTVGDDVTVSVLTGRRPVRTVRVTNIVETFLGMPAYMEHRELNRLLGDGPVAEGVNLLIDSAKEADILLQLREMPIVSSVGSRKAAIDTFRKTIEEMLLIFIGFYTAFAVLLGFGVAYNSARVALSENGRDLATLRVLGFTRGEISYICLAETGLLAVLALPLGCLLGYGLSHLMAAAFATELFRIPVVVTQSTMGQAALISITATLASLLLVRRRLDRLDLIRVLKTRE